MNVGNRDGLFKDSQDLGDSRLRKSDYYTTPGTCTCVCAFSEYKI